MQGIAVSATAFHRRGQANEDEENSTETDQGAEEDNNNNIVFWTDDKAEKDDVVVCMDIADVAKMYHYEMAGSSGTWLGCVLGSLLQLMHWHSHGLIVLLTSYRCAIASHPAPHPPLTALSILSTFLHFFTCILVLHVRSHPHAHVVTSSHSPSQHPGRHHGLHHPIPRRFSGRRRGPR